MRVRSSWLSSTTYYISAQPGIHETLLFSKGNVLCKFNTLYIVIYQLSKTTEIGGATFTKITGGESVDLRH